MKALVGDFIKLEGMLSPRRVIFTGYDPIGQAYHTLENGSRVFDGELSHDDVLLESEVIGI